MSTETFRPERVLLTLEGRTSVYRAELSGVIDALPGIGHREAEDLVATAGEDERGYGLRDRAMFLDALCRTMDEFLADDEGGYFSMIVHVTRYERCRSALEFWFHVSRPGATSGGIWIRHMVVAIDARRLYADMGPAAATE